MCYRKKPIEILHLWKRWIAFTSQYIMNISSCRQISIDFLLPFLSIISSQNKIVIIFGVGLSIICDILIENIFTQQLRKSQSALKIESVLWILPLQLSRLVFIWFHHHDRGRKENISIWQNTFEKNIVSILKG